MNSRDDLLEQSGIVIRLLGPLALERHGKPLGHGVKKRLALLAYLCLRSGGYAPRETLVGLLWADSGEEQARASLRQTLSGLRKAMGGPMSEVVSSDTAGLSLAP